MYTNELNISFPLRTWTENTFPQEKTHWISGKENVSCAVFSKEEHTDCLLRGARGVVVIVVGIGHGDTSSNPGRDWLHFT